MNDLDEKNEKARKEFDGDVYNNTANQIGTCDEAEEEDEDEKDDEDKENDSSHESEEYGAGYENYSVSIHLLFIIV